MAVSIVKGSDLIEVEHPVFMVFGQPGIGKTSLGYSLTDPLLLDFDRGAHRAVNRRDTLSIASWDDVIELTASPAHLAPYKSVTVDTVGRCLDLMVAHIAATDPKLAPGGNPTLQGWGKLKTMFRSWMQLIRNQGKDVLLIAHDKEERDGDTRIVRPDIAGGSYGEVLKVADFIGYLQMNGRERMLDFNPTDRWIGKNPALWKPIAVPAPELAQTFMADLMTKGREALGHASAESATVAAQVETLRKEFETYTTAAECTGAIVQLIAAGLPATVRAPAWTLLQARAAALGCTYDKAAKAFIGPAVLEAPAGAGGVELPPATEKPKRRRVASPRHDEGETAPNGHGEGI